MGARDSDERIAPLFLLVLSDSLLFSPFSGPITTDFDFSPTLIPDSPRPLISSCCSVNNDFEGGFTSEFAL